MKITFDPMCVDDIEIVKTMINDLGLPTVKTPPIPTAVKKSFPVDANGVSWNGNVHTNGKLKTVKGFWKRKKGVSESEYNQYAAENVVAPAPVAPAPVAPAPAPIAPAPAPIAPAPAPIAPAPAPIAPAPVAPAPVAPAPAPIAPAPAPIAPAPAPIAPAPAASNMLEQIDEMFADLETKGHTDDFTTWSSQMLDWVKQGAKTVLDLDGDVGAQKKLLAELSKI